MPIERPSFATTLMRVGYDTADVDEAVDRVMAALALPEPGITVPEIEALAFAPVSYRRGYDMEQVDDWLDDVVDELRQRAGGTALPSAAAPAPAAYEPPPGAIVPVESDSTRLLVVLVTVAVLAVLLYVSFA